MSGVRRFIALLVFAGLPARGAAQDSTKAACDSVIAAAKVDVVSAGIFLAIQEIEGTAPEEQLRRIVINVANELVPPRPCKLNVFAGPSLVRGMRAIGADTVRVTRPVTFTGTYRVHVAGGDSVPDVMVVRRSLVGGFDSAAVKAIRAASTVPGVFTAATGSPMTIDLAFTSDSLPHAQRLFSGDFPRMPVKDAVARADNPPPPYPSDPTDDGALASVMLRFVVATDGVVEPATVEVVRLAPPPFVRAAYQSLNQQRFEPATVNGCPVAQQVDYPFAFIPPEHVPQGLTRR
jgi:hypothetical protein